MNILQTVAGSWPVSKEKHVLVSQHLCSVSDLLLGEESARVCSLLLPGPVAGLARPAASHQPCFILSTHPSNVSFGHSFCAMPIAQPNGFALLITSLCVTGVVYSSCQRPTFRTARLEGDRALRRAARLSPACLWDLGCEVGTPRSHRNCILADNL